MSRTLPLLLSLLLAASASHSLRTVTFSDKKLRRLLNRSYPPAAPTPS